MGVSGALALLVLVLTSATQACAGPAIDTLVAAYPNFLAGSNGNDLIWKDGTRMPISDGKSGKNFNELLDTSDIGDQFAYPYPLGAVAHPPGLNEDPGRIRYAPLFLKMYGDCRKGEVVQRMKSVPWLRAGGGGSVLATMVNGVAEKLAAVSRELETLPEGLRKFMVPPAGTYNCRDIAKTRRLSVHAFGAAIDLNTKYSDYWLWAKPKGGSIPWKNRLPQAIVDVFERHGFIWGGKWYHYDTMHFEYRPELIEMAKQGWKRK